MPTQHDALPLTGERTVPGIERENYWFRRHEAVYAWIATGGAGCAVAGSTVVEAGCGEGYGAQLLTDAGADVVAVDYDDAAIEHVRRRYPAVSAVRANLVDLPQQDDSVDLLVSLQVIEHLWDLAGFLREAHRVLRPGGTIVVSTPNRLTFSPGLGRGEKPTNPFHVEEFDAEQMPTLLVAAGFADPHTHGLFHGGRLTELEHRRGAGIVQQQIDAILSDDWAAPLLADVAEVSVGDFDIARIDGPGAANARRSLDLIGTATKAAR